MKITKRVASALMALVMTLTLVNSAVVTAFAEGTQDETENVVSVVTPKAGENAPVEDVTPSVPQEGTDDVEVPQEGTDDVEEPEEGTDDVEVPQDETDGTEESGKCETHTDADSNGFCDVCGVYFGAEQTYQLPVKLVIPQGSAATFYTGEDGTGAPIAATDLGVDEKNPLIHKYELSIPYGSYSCMVTDETHNYGGVGFEFPLQTSIYEETNLTLVLVKFYSNTTSVKVNGENVPVNLEPDDFTVNLVAPGKANIIPGENYLDDTLKANTTYAVAPRMVWAYGNHILYNLMVELNGELAKSFGVKPKINMIYRSTVTSIQTQTVPVEALMTFTLTAPTAAKTVFYYQINNFNNMVMEGADRLKSVDNGDGTTTYTVYYPSFANASYRVTQEGYVTAAGYAKDNTAYTVELRQGDPTSTETAIASKAGAGSAIEYENSVYLNIDDTKDTNELALQVGETFRLRAFRAAWEIVNTTTANIMIEPDFHYAVLSGADVVSVTPVTEQCTGNANGNWMDVTALKEGTATIAVWYDAIDVGGNTTLSGTYGATDPARYGLVQITVGADETVTWNPVSYDGDWDAEFDTVYYFGDHGTMTIAPEGAVSVTVQNIHGATAGEAQTVQAEDGRYNVPVTSGNNLIAVTTAAGTDYMVVRAKKISYSIENKTTGEMKVNDAPTIKKGDTVVVHFDQFNMPVAKMSGIYNPGYMGTAKTYYTLNGQYVLSSMGTQYDFIADAKSCITFTALVPGENVLSGGHIQSGSMGDRFGNHRNITDAGRGTNFSAVNVTGNFCSIEDIRFNVTDDPDAAVNYDELVKLSKVSVKVGDSARSSAVSFSKASDANSYGSWAMTTEQMAAKAQDFALRVNVTPANYYTTLQLRYWYEGDAMVHTADLTADAETVIPWSEFAHDATKILNVEVLVTPGDPAMGPTKVYSYVVTPGNDSLKYVHPMIRDMKVTDKDGNVLPLEEPVSYTRTEYTIDRGAANTITLNGEQLQKYKNAKYNTADRADTVTVQRTANGKPVGEPIQVMPLTEERYPVGEWTLENLDMTGADGLEIKVASYVDGTSRTYHFACHSYDDNGVCVVCSGEPYAFVKAPVNAEAGKDATFEIWMSSRDALSCGQVKLAAQGGVITKVQQGSGLKLSENGSFKSDNNVVSFFDNTAPAAGGILVATVTVRVDDFADLVKLTISDAVSGTSGDTMDKTVGVVNGDGVKVTAVSEVKVEEFADGLYQVTYTGTIPEGMTLLYNGEVVPVTEDGKALLLVSAEAAAALKNSSFSLAPSSEKPAPAVIRYGDINGNGKINIVDAQIALDIAKGNVYTGSKALSQTALLAADVNGDGVVDAKDAFAIQIYVHFGAFTKPAGN